MTFRCVPSYDASAQWVSFHFFKNNFSNTLQLQRPIAFEMHSAITVKLHELRKSFFLVETESFRTVEEETFWFLFKIFFRFFLKNFLRGWGGELLIRWESPWVGNFWPQHSKILENHFRVILRNFGIVEKTFFRHKIFFFSQGGPEENFGNSGKKKNFPKVVQNCEKIILFGLFFLFL